MLRVILTVHIIAGTLGLLSGFIALYARKGATRHRSSGTLFVYSMVTMSILGVVIAGGWRIGASVNVPVGVVTAYLVITGLTTVVPPRRGSRWLDAGLMLAALTVGLLLFARGAGLLVEGGKYSWLVVPLFTFGTIALLGSAGDARVLRSGPRTGGPRLARHLWRMTTALLIAALSITVRLPRILPQSMQNPFLLSLPMLAVFATMLYWLWRVRSRQSPRSVVVAARSAGLAAEAV